VNSEFFNEVVQRLSGRVFILQKVVASDTESLTGPCTTSPHNPYLNYATDFLAAFKNCLPYNILFGLIVLQKSYVDVKKNLGYFIAI